MKKRNGVYLLLSVLEGLLSGAYFYLGQREREPLHVLSGCTWLACSFFHGLLGLEDDSIILMEDMEDD